MGAPFQSTGGTYDGAAYIYTNFFTRIIGEANLPLPQSLILHQNYPNPFNPETIIKWQLVVSSHVNLTVYNILGQKITTLVDEKKPAGTHSIRFNASILPSGIYYYYLQAGDYQDMKKMVIVK